MRKTAYYRPDIDGLRAFAVIAVILFHLGVPGWSGGFVGVDVFFVISGFLITSIILREIHEERFSLIQFWERRVRRIIPAMSFIIFATLVASYFITLYPVDFKAFGLTVAAQSIFMANIFFMRQTAYFAAPTDTIPLLHTWSLGVEEQFYVLFPLLLLLIATFAKKHTTKMLIALAAVSFTISIYLVNVAPFASFNIPFVPHLWGGATNQSAGFYFSPARAWELLLGAILASSAITFNSRKLAEVVSLVSVAILVLSFFITTKTNFPGYMALAPVLATSCLILVQTKHKTFVYELLSFPLFVWTGLISYSLYLWHWPIIVLSRQYWIDGLPHLYTPFFFIIVFLLSAGTYFLIEEPFRTKKLLPRRMPAFATATIILFLLGTSGIYIYKHNGLLYRAPGSVQAIANAATDYNPRRNECFKININKLLTNGTPCFMGTQTDTHDVDFVLWGNSHADAVMPAFEKIAEENNLHGAFFAVGGCSPLIVKDHVISNDDGCRLLKQHALQFIKDHNVKEVVLASSWNGSYQALDGTYVSLEDALANTLKLLPQDQHVLIMKQIPYQTYYDARTDFYRAAKSATTITTEQLSYSQYLSDTATTSKAIDDVSKSPKVDVLDPSIELCDEETCHLTVDGKIIYRDASHINETGAELLIPLIKNKIFI